MLTDEFEVGDKLMAAVGAEAEVDSFVGTVKYDGHYCESS